MIEADQAIPDQAPPDQAIPDDAPAKETHEGFVSAEDHQHQVNKQFKKFKDEARRTAEAEARATDAEKKLADIEAQTADVEIPAVPDPYSDTYAEDVSKRDAAIVTKTEQGAAVLSAESKEEQENEARKADAIAALDKRVAVFNANTVVHGLNQTEMQAAANIIVEQGISDTFESVLLEDPDGPLFVKYLAANPIEVETMNGMSALQLVNHLNGDLRQKALLLKPQTSSAPDPPKSPSGGGAPETKPAWEQGITWDLGNG